MGTTKAARANNLLGPGNYRRIARSAGIAPQHVARVLRGTRGASLHVAARIAEAAGVTLDEMYAFIKASPELAVKGRPTRQDLTPHATIQ